MALHKNLTGEDAVHPFALIGAADPGAVGAGKGWLDTSTTPHTLKYRNAANDGWEGIQAASAGGGLVALAVQFGNGETADAAGAVRIVRVPAELTPAGFIVDADAACSAAFAIEKSPAGSAAWSSLVGSGTAPALTAASHAADTDGAVNWSGGAVAPYGALRVTLASYTAGSSKLVTLTLLFARA